MSIAEETDKGWTPEIIEGGKLAIAPKDPTGQGNWLSLLDKGTIFLYRKRASHPGYKLEIFQVIHQWGDAALLGRHYEDQPDYLEYVDTKLFSNLHEWFKTIMVLPKQEQQPAGEENDTGDRANQP